MLDTLHSGNAHHRDEHQLVVQYDAKKTTRHVLISSVWLILDNRPRVLVMIEDITQQKWAEGLVRQREAELARMNRLHAIGEMAAALAHELNQPLHAMNNYVQGLQRRLKKQKAGLDQGQVIDVMDHIATEVSRAAGIVARLREFVRGRQPHRSTVDIRLLLQQAVELLRPAIRAKSVTLELEPGGDLPTIQADPIQIEQIVVNLVANAVDAVSGLPPERRKVTIEGRLAETDFVEIAVRDQGRGVPENIRDNLFEAFITTKKNGLGLGLAISRSIVESHGGKIWVVHHKPHGAAFHFSLPLNPVSNEESHDH